MSAVRARHWLFFLLWTSLLALRFQRIKFQLLNRTWCREMTSWSFFRSNKIVRLSEPHNCWMPLLAPLPTHQVSASESHVVPRNDLVKLATPPALQVEVRSCRTYFTRYPVEPSTRAATYEAQDSENGLWRKSKWISMRKFWDGHSDVAVGMVIMNNN